MSYLKTRNINNKKIWLYFTYLPRRPALTDFHLILHSCWSCGRNHLWQIFSDQLRDSILWGVKTEVSRRLSKWLLTQGCATVQPVMICQLMKMRETTTVHVVLICSWFSKFVFTGSCPVCRRRFVCFYMHCTEIGYSAVEGLSSVSLIFLSK